MDDKRADTDRGFTLIEIAVTVAIIATTVAAGVGVSLASRSFAVSTAAAEFDHLLDSARTIARETQGATLVFAPDAYGDGTDVRVLAPGPNGTLTATTLPIMHTHATIEEQQSLGKAPFALVVHASGALGGRPGYRLGDTTPSPEVGCPPSGSFHFTIHTAGMSADRYIACHITLAATGPVALASWPPAIIAPPPTPCTAGPCAPPTLPTPPSSTASCPPNYTTSPTGCTPTPPPPSGPRYHVTASLSSPTMTIGGPDDSLTASATLTNPNAVPPVTPPQLPVLLQQTTSTTCTATPPGAQPSGSAFTLKAIAPGQCTVVIVADTSSVPGATSDNATMNVAVSGAGAIPTPTPSPCDLIENGKCYQRIVGPIAQMFRKYVAPDQTCSTVDGTVSCNYVDAIQHISILPGYDFTPKVPATGEANELLFRINRIMAVESHCQPFSSFSTVPPNIPIQWGGTSIGAPVDALVGTGEPSVFLTVNHVLDASQSANFDLTRTPWTSGTTLLALYSALAFQLIGPPYSFTFSDQQPNADTTLHWYPDFPGCDVSGDPNFPVQYGFSGVDFFFEIFQATL